MLDEVSAARWSEFSRTAQRYELRYVALPAEEREKLEERDDSVLRRVFSATDRRGWDVYRREEPAAGR
jgi:hypothetical protein